MNPTDDFFAGQRFAIFGAKASGRSHGAVLIQALQKAGKTPIAVQPDGAGVKGAEIFGSLAEAGDVSGVVILPPDPWNEEAATFTADAVRQCKECGINSLWIYTAGDYKPAQAIAVESQLDPVVNRCPCLNIEGAGFPHGFHRWLERLFGKL